MSDSSPPAPDTNDPTATELRRLLRADELGIDPQQRERAIGAALAAADERPGPARDDRSSDAPIPLDPNVERRRDPRRLRVVAAAAAVLIVVAGTATILSQQGGSQSSSSEDAGAALSTAVPSAAESSKDAAGDAAIGSDGSVASTDPQASTTTGSSRQAPGADGDFPGIVTVALPALGEFGDAASLLAASAGLVDTTSARSGDVSGSATACTAVLSAAGAQPVATATILGAPVLVAVSATSPSTIGRQLVLASADCTMVAN